MRMGVGYNVFNGLELLKPSILSVRDFSRWIVVVYSERAITGEACPEYTVPLLMDLKKSGLVDQLIRVEHPATDEPVKIQNEKRKKYEIARQACLKKGCRHFMGRDCDEFLVEEDIRQAVEKYGDRGMVVCPALDYVQRPTMQARSTGLYHIPAFHKCGLPYRPVKSGVLLDLGRTCLTNDFAVLKADELVVHHMTGVRYDDDELRRKFQGHSHFCRKGQGHSDKYVQHISSLTEDSYEPVPDQFGVLEYWRDEFKQWHDG